MSKSAPSSEDPPVPHTLDGWWVARAASLGGVRLPSEALPALTMLLFNRTLYLGSDIGSIDVDRGMEPATLDILITRGPNRWRFIPGIFKQYGRTLQLCLDLSGATRPDAFLAPFGSRLLSVTYERAPVCDRPAARAERALKRAPAERLDARSLLRPRDESDW